MDIYSLQRELQTKSIFDLKLRVCYYARVSTEREEQKTSIIHQEEHYEEKIRANPNWTYAGAYVDNGISGIHVQKRDGFQRMIADAKNGKFDLIITKEICRFARNTLDSIKYSRELLSYGVFIWFETDNIKTCDVDSELRLAIMSGVVQDESLRLSMRVKFGHQRSIEQGVVLGNSHLYGFNKKDGRLTIDPYYAEMIQIIFERYASGESSTVKLEQELYDLGYRSYKGKKICAAVIKHIIVNPKYKGYYVGNKVKIVDMFTKKQKFLPESEWVMYKDTSGAVPAIVSEALWDKANEVYRNRSEQLKSRRTSLAHTNTYTGKIFCGNDGSTYWMKEHVGKYKDRRWVCSNKLRNGAKSCSSFAINEVEMNQIIAECIQGSIQNMEQITQHYLSVYISSVNQGSDHRKQIETLQEKRTATLQKRAKLLDYNLEGIVSDEEFAERNPLLTKEISRLDAAIKELTEVPITVSEFEKELQQVKKNIRACADITEKDINRKFIEATISKIVVTPQEDHEAIVQIHLKDGKLTERLYRMGCSGYMVKKMIEAQERQMAGK